jgi:hypothetical protein
VFLQSIKTSFCKQDIDYKGTLSHVLRHSKFILNVARRPPRRLNFFPYINLNLFSLLSSVLESSYYVKVINSRAFWTGSKVLRTCYDGDGFGY